MKKIVSIIAAIAVFAVFAIFTTGCGASDADVAAKNISKAAEQFEVYRRIVFINGITDNYLFVVEGYCSLETTDSALGGSLEVTCRIGNDAHAVFKKLFLGLSDNVTYLVDQPTGIKVSTNHYRVIFKPETIVPNFDRP